MATTNPTDPNKIRLTGENSFIRLSDDASKEETTRASHWRVLWSPGGTGHVLFLQSELTDNEVQIYSDNIALTRWLQDEIESLLHPAFADQTMQVVDAEFTRKGDPSTFWTETIINDEAEIAMTWHDFMEPYMLVVPAGSASGRQPKSASLRHRSRAPSPSTTWENSAALRSFSATTFSSTSAMYF